MSPGQIIDGPMIHSTATVDPGADIHPSVKIWHYTHVMAPSSIAQNSQLGQNVFVAARVRIGRNVRIQNNVSLFEGVILEDDVFCGPSCVFTNVINPRAHVPRKGSFRRTLVQRGATIGANATIVCGHTIGRFAMVGAGAVVTRDVPDHALVYGNPALAHGWVCECGEKLALPAARRGQCDACDLKFRLDETGLKRAEL